MKFGLLLAALTFSFTNATHPFGQQPTPQYHQPNIQPQHHNI